MFDPQLQDGPVFDYEALTGQFDDQGVAVSVARVHGCLCGLLAAGAATIQERALAALAEALDVEVHGELAEAIMQLYLVSASALADEAFDFHPLLPDDETDIGPRAEALGDWCAGFLAGFALVAAGGGTGTGAADDTREVLTDLAAMARASADDGPDEESEQSYFELVEYLRFAVMNVYADTLARLEDEPAAPGDGTLH
jgi:uncharacterized protein YgfB (UPF0149 family)